MLYWVIVLLDGSLERFFGTNLDAVTKATTEGKALYGPFSTSKDARGCICNLQSTEAEVKKIAEKHRVELSAPATEVKMNPKLEETKRRLAEVEQKIADAEAAGKSTSALENQAAKLTAKIAELEAAK